MARKLASSARPQQNIVSSPADLGQWIRFKRLEAKLRIDDAASLCGVSVQLLSDVENGNRAVGIDKLLAITEALGLSLQMTVRGEPLAVAPDEEGDGNSERP